MNTSKANFFSMDTMKHYGRPPIYYFCLSGLKQNSKIHMEFSCKPLYQTSCVGNLKDSFGHQTQHFACNIMYLKLFVVTVHTHTLPSIHKYTHTHTLPSIHKYAHSHTPLSIHKYTHTHVCEHMQKFVCTRSYTNIRILKNT